MSESFAACLTSHWFYSSELSDLKVSLCTNLSGKKPSRWTWAIQSFKELSLGAVHRWWTSRRSYVFVRCRKSYHTIAPSKSCETCVSMGTRYSCKYVQLKFLPSSYLIWSWIFQEYVLQIPAKYIYIYIGFSDWYVEFVWITGGQYAKSQKILSFYWC